MPVAPATDLIARCLAHDEGAWREFLQRYSRLIYSSIIKVGLPAEEKDEAFQAAVAAIYRQLPRLRDPEKLTSWIIGISWRQAINCIRSRSREVALEDVETAGSKALPSMTASQPLPDEERVMLERAQQAAEAMAGLTPRCRRLLSILFYEDPTPDYGEISRREGIPVGSIGPTRARCLDAARRIFRERGWKG